MFVSHLPTSPATPSRRQSAFTLVELSIVLVIIGLLVGGVLVGRDLIRAAELRGVITDIERFETARMAFKAKYNCIPGDCATASDFSLGTNGNGNGYVDFPTVSNTEHWQFWSQLAAANLIQGSYTGANGPDSAVRDAVIGSNVPAARMAGVGYFIYTPTPYYTSWSPLLDTNGTARALTDSNYIIGRDQSTDNAILSGFVSPPEAQMLDSKFDDGLANNGIIRANYGYASANTTGCGVGTAPNYSYNTDSSKLCTINRYFRTF